jgi:mono/diheme cytochrome c family protein
MTHTAKSRFVLLAALLFLAASVVVAQKKEIKKAPIKMTSPGSGAEMYKAYCASCHGPKGEGNGPAASALKVQPADLTTLTQRYGGKFPENYVTSVLRFGAGTPAHGSKEMPIWGPLLSSVSNADKVQVNMRISNLTHYIETLQKK